MLPKIIISEYFFQCECYYILFCYADTITKGKVTWNCHLTREKRSAEMQRLSIFLFFFFLSRVFSYSKKNIVQPPSTTK